MSKTTNLIANFSPVEKLLVDIPSIPRRAGQGLMAYYLTDKSSSETGKMPTAPDEDLTIMAALSAVTLLNTSVLDYASELEREEFAKRLAAVGNEAAKHIADESRRAKFNQNIIKNTSHVKGFNIAKALDDLSGGMNTAFAVDHSDKEAGMKLKATYLLLENVFIEAAAASKDESVAGGRYINSIKEKTNQILQNRPEILDKCAEVFGEKFSKDEFFKLYEGALKSGSAQPNPLKSITSEEKQKAQGLLLNASNEMLALLQEMNPQNLANITIRENFVNVARFSPEDKEDLRLKLDSIKELWSVEGMQNERGKQLLEKRAYLLRPVDANSTDDVEGVFSKICQDLCKVSNAKLLQKVTISDSKVGGVIILSSAMKEVGGSREYPERDKLISALLPQLMNIDSAILNNNREAITKLCAKAIDKHSSKSLPFFGDNTVTIKAEGFDKISEKLKSSLAQFQRAPKQDTVARPTSLPAGMPVPSSPPVVDRSKNPLNNQTSLKPRPVTAPPLKTRPVSSESKKEQPKVVTAKTLEKWERSELLPHGMPPAPISPQETSRDKPIPPVPKAVPITRPRSNAIDAGDVNNNRPSSVPPSITEPPIPPVPLARSVSEASHSPHPALSKSLKRNPILEAEEKSRREIKGWQSSYKNLGFVGRRGISRPPESNRNLGQSVKAWREWYQENEEKLVEKKFAIPIEYKDVMSKLEIAKDIQRAVGNVYNEAERKFVVDLKHLGDEEARLTILQKEAEGKRASREARLKAAPANLVSEGGRQEHDTPYPPPPHKVKREEKKGGSREGVRGRS